MHRTRIIAPWRATDKVSEMNDSNERFDAFQNFLSALESAGQDLNSILEASGLSLQEIASQRDPRIQGDSALRLLEAAVSLADDPALPIRIGQSVDIGQYGVYGFALMTSANLRAALTLNARYAKFTSAGIKWNMIEGDDGLILRLRQTLGTNYQQRLMAELLFSSLHTVGRSLATVSSNEAKLQLSYAKPQPISAYRKFWPFKIEFECEHNQIFVPKEWLSLPVRTANPSENVIFIQRCEEMLRGINTTENTSAAVRRLLMQSAGTFYDIAKIAGIMHLTERTLRRRLAAESTSFRRIFDEVRNLLAQKYLSSTSLSVADIAGLLDYSETANFRRAFIRWNGITPAEYRKQSDARATR